ncbi:hypothetical protein ACT4S5_13285 [Kocuria oceani]|uniref:hypothetical protein n=1 Tax=Kocuria oceani TaxID=988827 RepID=UPI004035B269
MTQQATQHKPLRHKITDVLLVLALLTLVLSAIIEVISWMAGFAYPFLDRLIYPLLVLIPATVISPMYDWKKDSTGPVQGGLVTVAT